MVLVDTSVWIRGLAHEEPFSSELGSLLDGDEVAGHDLVYGQLLIGDTGGRKKFLESYSRMHWAEMVPHDEVVAFVRDRDLPGRGVGWVDVHLLASAIAARMQLWTADARLAEMAAERRVGYQLRY
jgi:predicted nucleic acid-binding protein